MKFRRVLIAFSCVTVLLMMTACGGSKTEDSSAKKEEKQEEADRIAVSGPEWASGDLVLNVPDGWEVSPDDDENNWETERVKVYESEHIKDTGGSTYGDVYADIQKKAVEDACNMIRKKYHANDISEITGLPLEKVRELENQVNVKV